MNNKIQQELDRIEIPKELRERSKLGIKIAKYELPKRKYKKAIIIPLVASIFLVFSVGVGAASIPSFNNLISIVSPKIALLLHPIENTSEDAGIRMEVVAAMNDDEMAVIYVTMKDLTGNRIDETLDLYDYSFTGAHMFNSQIVDYDELTGTATLRIQGNGSNNLNDKKVNFHIDSFLSHKQIFDEVKVPANLVEIKNKIPETMRLDMTHISGVGGKLMDELIEQETIQILKPDKMTLFLPKIEFFHVSNIGFIDNRLHVQVKWTGDDMDSHGYFYFIDNSGNKTNSSSISFGIDELGNATYGNEYTDFIFDIDHVNLNEQTLLGHFVSNGNYTVGNWNTTFKVQSVDEEKHVVFNKDFGTWKANRISISPLGVTIDGNGEINNSSQIEVIAKMNDGSVKILDSFFIFSENKKVKVKFIPSLPLDISKIESLDIDGTKIDF
ncbi:hypothetical protein [Psychrobacillus sp. L3]|uniref:hypothetical protein n=1 Tax=Psychrobacillus sp. L3 TaxID=3236891 RepID=UPI0036F37FB5